MRLQRGFEVAPAPVPGGIEEPGLELQQFLRTLQMSVARHDELFHQGSRQGRPAVRHTHGRRSAGLRQNHARLWSGDQHRAPGRVNEHRRSSCMEKRRSGAGPVTSIAIGKASDLEYHSSTVR
jgi:hypothetical protein